MMDKWDVVGVGILVVLALVSAYTMERRDGWCLFREECWVESGNWTYYGGFWCDCDNFIERNNITDVDYLGTNDFEMIARIGHE